MSERSERTDGTSDDADDIDHLAPRTCPGCGTGGLEAGYLEDQGEGSLGFLRWIAGPIVMGRLHRAKVDRHRARYRVTALRCPSCRLLSLYTGRRA